MTIEELEKAKDTAYWERNQLVAALSKIFPAKLAKHDPKDEKWEADWRTIVVIELPINTTYFGDVPDEKRRKAFPQLVWNKRKGNDDFEYLQLTWHIHDTDIPLCDHLNYYDPLENYWWDGHTTEEEYRRLRAIKPIKQSSNGLDKEG